MTYDTTLTTDQRDVLAVALEDAGWHSPAADIRDGVTPEVVLSRLHRVSSEDGEYTVDAAELIERHIEEIRRNRGGWSRS